MEGVKALLVFGEDPAPELLKELVFLMVCDTHMTEAAKLADVVIPGTGFASTYGTFTNTERRLQVVEQAIEEDVVFSNWEVAAELAHVYEVEMPFDDVEDISDEMNDKLPVYRYAEMGEDLWRSSCMLKMQTCSCGRCCICSTASLHRSSDEHDR